MRDSSSTTSSIIERRIQTSRLNLRTRETGDGRLIVLMHGITANAAIWDPVTALLGQDHHVVAIDQRGHGGSDRPDVDPTSYQAEAYALDVISLIETLGAAPAVLVGHSLGARNAIVAGRLRPDLVHAVVAIDYTPRIEAEVLDALAARVKGGDRTFQSVAEIVEYLRGRYPLIPINAIQRRAEHGYRASEEGLRPLADPAALAATAEGLRESFEADFMTIDVPTLLVRGAGSKLVSPAAWAAATTLRPDLLALEVPGTDHYVPEEAPDAVVDVIRAFLAEHV